MITLNEYLINKGNKHLVNKYNYFPETSDELEHLIYKLIDERGYEADLNDIDTSKITNMRAIFEYSNFDGDISQWDVSNVIDMAWMFAESHFTGKNGDISQWDVRKVTNTTAMFYKCPILKKNMPKFPKIK